MNIFLSHILTLVIGLVCGYFVFILKISRVKKEVIAIYQLIINIFATNYKWFIEKEKVGDEEKKQFLTQYHWCLEHLDRLIFTHHLISFLPRKKRGILRKFFNHCLSIELDLKSVSPNELHNTLDDDKIKVDLIEVSKKLINTKDDTP